MRYTLSAISCAVVAFFDRRCGRELAINAVAETEAQLEPPDWHFKLPPGVSPTGVAARRDALIAATGMSPDYALKFAIDAEEQQLWHDNPKLREGTQALPKTEAERGAQAILDAHPHETQNQ